MGFLHRDSKESKEWEELNKLRECKYAPEHHKAKLSHQLISGAAAFSAAKAWEEHKKKHGRPSDHAKAKQIAAGFAGVFVDRFIESHGLDFVDRERAKHEARKRVELAIDTNGF
ncbi:hypothetical protein CROQUDRAFT_650316 [Cronartium quercuum f. sp. fusiforme G11]|uniref:CipC-like antibiotic response protein n=1 Tax=Cronartium quercuum f. sp. fusiforme G11 TaxID=708437 RepID=A0A9P6NXN9_9BASI|nr:hypothetical protein CROQUDRAFT_650316 [Cronartium quercuum f. sp. fusiforme G11]